MNNKLVQPLQFDISRDFELRDILDKTKNSDTNKENLNSITGLPDPSQMEQMIRTLPIINDTIRADIKLSVEIYKKLNNFDRNYIHSVINENSIKGGKSKHYKNTKRTK